MSVAVKVSGAALQCSSQTRPLAVVSPQDPLREFRHLKKEQVRAAQQLVRARSQRPVEDVWMRHVENAELIGVLRMRHCQLPRDRGAPVVPYNMGPISPSRVNEATHAGREPINVVRCDCDGRRDTIVPSLISTTSPPPGRRSDVASRTRRPGSRAGAQRTGRRGDLPRTRAGRPSHRDQCDSTGTANSSLKSSVMDVLESAYFPKRIVDCRPFKRNM